MADWAAGSRMTGRSGGEGASWRAWRLPSSSSGFARCARWREGGADMSVNKAIKLYRSKGLLSKGLLNDDEAIDALLDAGYTVKWHGQGPYDTAWCTVIELERGC